MKLEKLRTTSLKIVLNFGNSYFRFKDSSKPTEIIGELIVRFNHGEIKIFNMVTLKGVIYCHVYNIIQKFIK